MYSRKVCDNQWPMHIILSIELFASRRNSPMAAPGQIDSVPMSIPANTKALFSLSVAQVWH